MSPTASAQAYQDYLAESRARWLRGQTIRVAEIRGIYANAADEVARDLARLLPTQPSARHLAAIQDLLREASETVTEQSLRATLKGIELSTGAGIGSARAIAHATLGNVLAAGSINAMYSSINQRAVLAFSTRRRFDGLRLSDRVWRIGSQYRGELGRAVEHGIARGLDSRKLAREIQQHLNPEVAAPHSASVRARLKLSRDVSYQSMRLARTEMSNAFREGTVLGHRATPSYEGSIWEISGSHPVLDECDDLAVGENGRGFYAAGNEPFAPHPNCLCVLSPVHRDPEEFTQELERWLDDPSSSPELESWYNDTARPLIGDQPIKPLSAPPRAPVTIGAAPKASVSTGKGISAPTTRALTQAATAPTRKAAAKAGAKAQKAADDVIEKIAPDSAAAGSQAAGRFSGALEKVREQRRIWDGLAEKQGANVDELRDAILDLGREARLEVKARLSKIKGHDALEDQLAAASKVEQDLLAELDGLKRKIAETKKLRSKLASEYGSPAHTGATNANNAAVHAYNAHIDKIYPAQQAVLKLAKKVSKSRHRVIKEVVGEVRKVGAQTTDGVYTYGSAHKVSAKAAQTVTEQMDEALQLLPQDWLNASAARGKFRLITHGRRKGAGGYYLDGAGGTLQASGSAFNRFNTLVHELGHRMQYTVGRFEYAVGSQTYRGSLFKQIEESFRTYRAAGEASRTNLVYGADWIEDRFVEGYFGIMNPSGASEMFTRGMESLFNGRWSIYADDEEFMDYMLGMLMGI